MKWQYFLYAVVIAGTGITVSHAQETSTVSLALVPIQTAFVKGDLDKFRAMNWIKDGSQSGIGDSALNAKFGKDTIVSFEGSGMFKDSDYSGQMLVIKDGVGYIKMNYGQFRKYYDNKGGYFPSFTSASLSNSQSLRLITLGKELSMDIGKFSVEIGKGTPEDSSLSLGYQRDTKDGSKDRLTWGYVKDTAFGSTTLNERLLAPTFADEETNTDTITLKGKTKAAGFTLKGEQKVVLYSGNIMSQAQMESNSATAADNQIVRATTIPNTKEMMTTLAAERWSLNDKTFFAIGYRFAHLHNDTYWTHRELSYLTGADLNTKNYDVWAKTNQDSNIVTAQLLSNLTDKLAFISRFKAEVRSTTSQSDVDTSATSAISLATASNVANVSSTAESFSLRYAGLPKASLYADLDLKQERYARTLFTPAAVGSHAGTMETLNHTPEGLGTIGTRFSPMKSVNVTTEYKHSVKNDKLEAFQNTIQNDAYMNIFRTDNDQVMSRVSWKPVRWLENSFKVQQVSTVYHVQALSRDMSKTPGSERDFVYDVALLPTDKWMFNLSYSLKLLKVEGRGEQSTFIPPASTSNVYSYMLTTSYMATEKLSLFNSLEFSRAKNRTNDSNSINLTPNADTVNGVGAVAMLWGNNDAWWDIDTGAKWEPKKNLTIEPHYAYYTYEAYPGIEAGNYSAHVVWLDVNVKW
ncbi:MAG: hypothetical protein HQL19_01500 [Candidatus Omnitrophica bacterium]|nr:hypothetical protein [Candidatus Omnitrophota bacterium]